MDVRRKEAMTEEHLKRREARRRAEKQRRLILRVILLLALVGILVALIVLLPKALGGGGKSVSPATPTPAPATSSAATSSEESVPAGPTRDEVLTEARRLAAQYDYDKAVATIEAFAGYDADTGLVDEIAAIREKRDACVPVSVVGVPHGFFHSLINDRRGLVASATCTEDRVAKNNKAMCTTGEFKAIIQKLYEAGYVLISLDDLVVKTKNDDGTVTMEKNQNLCLPEGKKPLLMSEDDLSYYHAYGENGAQGYADRLVLDENGQVKCEFTDVNGTVKVGDYDMVPILETFIAEHPDFCYRGARPTIALTGYNGIFGYRTNDYYKEGPDGEDLGPVQQAFLRNHPEYDYDKDCAEAVKIANALKAQGWTFASHTYGHRDAAASTVEQLAADHERWKIAVGQFVGETDKIIFAFGADIGYVGGYTAENEKYQYFRKQGFNTFCNVDGNFGWMEYGTGFVRTGRIAIDGVTMYNAMTEGTPSHETFAKDYQLLGITDIASFFDKNRNPEYCRSES